MMLYIRYYWHKITAPIKNAFGWFWHYILRWLLLAGAVGCIGLGVYSYFAIKQAPDLSERMLEYKANKCRIYDSQNHLIYTSSNFAQDYVTYKHIPKQFQNAVVATEDKDFWTEQGISPIGLTKGVISLIAHGGVTHSTVGGSTITQQLIKMSIFDKDNQDRTIKRKIQDIYLAFEISFRVPKQKILEYYINHMYEGQNVYGTQTISEVYYNKPLSKLDLSQTAYVAGIGQAPSYYNLYLHPKACQIRRNNVLLSMLNRHKITRQQYDQAKAEPIQQGLIPWKQSQQIRNAKEYPNWKMNKDYVRGVLTELDKQGIKYKNQDIVIHTALNQDAQNAVYNAVNNNPDFSKNNMQNDQAAATVIDPNNGGVVAQVGGRDLNGQMNQVNRAIEANRSSGSSIKPILDYAPAVEFLNWDENHPIMDTPYTYRGTQIQVHDWDNRYNGKMTMKNALIQSRNVPAIRALLAVGRTRATTFMNQMGINTIGEATPADAIGLDVSTQELAGAYGAFSTLGMYHKPSYITTVTNYTTGKTYHLQDTQGTRVMKDSTAYIITDILRHTIDDANGTAHPAFVGSINAAGKSGEVSSDVTNLDPNQLTDVWMAGYTPANSKNDTGYSCAVWVGPDKPSEPGAKFGSGGASTAEHVWQQIMQTIATKQSKNNWKQPDSVENINGNLKPLN